MMAEKPIINKLMMVVKPDPYDSTDEDPQDPQEDPEQPDKCIGGKMVGDKCICPNGKKLVKGECKENKCK